MSEVNLLLDGYRRFYRKHFVEHEATLPALAEQGQNPKTMIIACSDSRVDPAIITDAAPGEIFVVRNVANMVPPYQPETGGYHGVSAALEFGVLRLGVENIVVFGHSGCAGIRALMESDNHNQCNHTEGKHYSFIEPWVHIAEKAKDYTHNIWGDLNNPEAITACEQQAVLISLANLMSFPWISERVDAGKLELHGWYFRVGSGQLLNWGKQDNRFQPVSVEA